MKLVDIKQIKGKIILLSGLHIGAGDTEMHIGGTDNCVVTHPHSRLPYIPGSSLKGKVRALLEISSGLMGYTRGDHLKVKYLKDMQPAEKEAALQIMRLFGTSGADGDSAVEVGPARVSFSDCPLTSEWKVKAKDMPVTEIKAETAIDRISGTAKRGSLRMTERVVADVEFDFALNFKEMEKDKGLKTLLLKGLKLLEHDALGGSGSRGYGRVRFVFDEAQLQEKFDSILG